MNEKLRNVLVCVIFALMIAGCNLPTGTQLAEPTFTNEPVLPVVAIESAEEAENREVPAPANTDGADIVLVPGATYWMGSEETDENAGEDEMPWHEVTVSGFYIYTHEVTNAMYAACVEAGACLTIFENESGPTSHYADPEYAEHPVVGADWLMAEDYCNWAGGRLPTEAEWELAARGTESLAYPWGDEEPTCDRANLLGCSVPAETMKVGSYLNGNSPYEVWDMSGNVWEWVNDWYDEDYYALSSAINPVGPYYSKTKVARGGGLFSDPLMMRSAERVGVDPHRVFDDVGFRCVPTGLQLPADFTQPQDMHTRTGPDPLDGGGDLLGDPAEEGISWTVPYATCPNSAGQMYIFMGLETHGVPLEVSVTVHNNEFSCEYNEVGGYLSCIGEVPETNDEKFRVIVDFHDHYNVTIQVPRPQDCPADMEFPSYFGAEIFCADEAGFVINTFEAEPAIIWDTIRYEGEEIECNITSPNTTECILPARPADEFYRIAWLGHFESGEPANFGSILKAPEGCEERSLSAVSACFEGNPTTLITYKPTSFVIEEVRNGDLKLDCIGLAPGAEVCGPLLNEVGTYAEVLVKIEGDEEPAPPMSVKVLDCQSEQTNYAVSILPKCIDVPAVAIDYFPSDLPIKMVTANSVLLDCVAFPTPGIYLCFGIYGNAGHNQLVRIELSDGTVLNGEIIVPDCSGSTESDGSWTLVDVSCFQETNINMIIDTPMSELVAGVGFDYSAHTADGASSYSCEVNPNIAGRIFCWGAPPLHNSPLEVCVSPPGVAERCSSFSDFWTRLPNCTTQPNEEPSEEPNDEPNDEPSGGSLDCSIYDVHTCGSVAGCHWSRSSWSCVNN